MYDIYLNCREKKERVQNSHERERKIHTRTHTWQKKSSSAVVHEKKTNKRIDSILWPEREREKCQEERKTAQVSIR